MDKKIFDEIRGLVYQHAGINLHEGKESLVSSRLAKRIRLLELADHAAYLEYLKADKTGKEIIQLLDVISTNVTSFYRESDHFDFVREQMGQWMAKGQRRFRFWSAASSTGEEPYSLAITLAECVGNNRLDMRILATDISTQVLQKCRDGVYDAEKLKPVSLELRSRYFDTVNGSRSGPFRVKDSLKNMVMFRRLNLSQPPFPMKGPMDIIFIRNVMIYFDNNVRRRLLDEAYRLLKPGGYLLVGHAESLTGMVSSFKSIRPSIYVKN